MKSVSREAKPYVCEADRSLPEKEQTVFWIKPKTYQEVNRSMGRYGSAFTEDNKGFKVYHVNKLNEADQKEWNDVVVMIENFCFSDELLNNELKDMIDPTNINKVGKDRYVKVIGDRNDTGKDVTLKKEVLNHLPADVISEIWKACQNESVLKEGQKNV